MTKLTAPKSFATLDRAATIAWFAAALDSIRTLGRVTVEVETFACKAIRQSPHRDVVTRFRKAVAPQGLYTGGQIGSFALSMIDADEYYRSVHAERDAAGLPRRPGL